MSTIAAISTPRGVGGISVIRISGDMAAEICGRIFRPISTKLSPTEMEGYTCAFGKVFDGEEYVDDCVLTIFKAPKSYTGEDVCEISCHGGIYVTERILSMIFSCGAIPAEAGEFTKRGFLNGKMDLTGAEAVMDIISAEGKASHRCAASLREGRLFTSIHAVSDKLVHLLGEIGAWIDYPEEDIPEVENSALLCTLESAKSELDRLLCTYDGGKIIREGIDTAIVGKPNVGKSTLMNLLSGCERSIVTDVAGTTRDVIEESVRLGEYVLRLSDTAGIRDTADAVESVGVKLAQSKISSAQLVLAVFDNSTELTDDDREIISLCSEKNACAVINKTDCVQKLDCGYVEKSFDHVVYISASNGDGLDRLKAEVEDIFRLNSINFDMGVLCSERQKNCVRDALRLLGEAISAVSSGITLDAVNIVLDSAAEKLLELTGEKTSEAVVNEVFSHFCVGK